MENNKKRMQLFNEKGFGEVRITITAGGDPRYCLRAVVEDGFLRVELPEAMRELEAADGPQDGSHLPSALRWRCENPEAWRRATERGFVAKTATGWQWLAGSEKLLAYFCGRLVCGDDVRPSKRCGYVWEKGVGRFPAKQLNRMFGTASLRQLRDKGLGLRAPEGHEMVDRLFEMDKLPIEIKRITNKESQKEYQI